MDAIQEFKFDVFQIAKLQGAARTPFLERELQVIEAVTQLHLLRRDISNAIIGERVGLGEKTIDGVMSVIYGKIPLEKRTRVALLEFVCATLELQVAPLPSPAEKTVEEIIRDLTPVERSIALLVGDGYKGNNAISDALEKRARRYVTPLIVGSCIVHICNKLGVKSVEGLALWVQQNRAPLEASVASAAPARPATVGQTTAAGGGKGVSGTARALRPAPGETTH